MSTYSILLSFILSLLLLSRVNARTCCCAAFTYESCLAEHDIESGHCVWRDRISFGPSIGEKGVCRTEQWVAIQQSKHNHHPFHTTSSSKPSIPFISIPKNKFSSDPSANDGLIAHGNDPANPDNYDWPNICFTEEANKLPCNANEEEIAAQVVEVEHIENVGKTMSIGVISTIITLIAFIALVVGLTVYWQERKDENINEYALDDINVVRTYSTFELNESDKAVN